MGKRGQAKVRKLRTLNPQTRKGHAAAANVKRKIRQLSYEQLHFFQCHLALGAEAVGSCIESRFLSDRGHSRDALQQLELPLHQRNREHDFAEAGRHAFTPAHLVLAINGVYLDPTESASHLCGNYRCLNIDHIIPETLEKNIARKYCPKDVRCACGTTIPLCAHAPKCINPHAP